MWKRKCKFMLHDSNYGLYSITFYSAIQEVPVEWEWFGVLLTELLLADTFVIVDYDNTQESM